MHEIASPKLGPAPLVVVAQQALDKAKREGLVLAVRALWAALAVIAVMLPIINPRLEIIYYIGAAGCAMLASDSVVEKARAEGAADVMRAGRLVARGPLSLRGLEGAIGVWAAP